MAKLLHLQGIRGVAICSVIAFHYFPDYFPNGYLGVDLFFVLSGYLMSIMLSRHSTLTIPIVAEFLYRRVKRIIPLYYLVVVISTAVIFVCPCSELISNMISAERATWLTTNLHWTTGIDYFEKLGVSHDLFTHTWSLCLEMQFYVIFPLLWWAQTRLDPTKRMVLLHVYSGASLYFYFVSDQKQAFNNMFCRIWQFLFGNMVHCLERYMDEPKSEKIPLLDEEESEEKEKQSLNWVFASLSLVLLIYSTITEQHLAQNYSRMTTTFVSIVLIHFGKGFYALENAPIVFFGEISYAWYLFHWPMLTLQQVYGHTTNLDMFLGIFGSFIVAVIAHYALEKKYLSWGKPGVYACAAILFASCLALHYGLTHNRYKFCTETPRIRTDYAQMTQEERKAYYTQLLDFDRYQLKDPRCIFNPPKEFNTAFMGPCKYENPYSNNNKTLLIIGNSWAANSSPLIFDECSKYFGNVHRTTFAGCEVFTPAGGPNCPGKEQAYLDSAEQLRPDYLFVVQRYCYSGLKMWNDTQWDHIMEVSEERLARLSNYTKEKIFILHTFPIAIIPRKELNDAMDEGRPIHMKVGRHWNIARAQRKLDELLENCPKCVQFDYSPQFMVNGSFQFFDPMYNLPYVNHGMHFTLPGLEKIRPVYTDICKSIG